MLGLVLDGNIFEFNGDLWQQKIGTAMGSRVAPTYACLFMGDLEKKLLQAWKGPAPQLWRRYIDDIFFVWSASVEDLKLFIKFINEQHPYIKFTATYDITTKTIPFLDMSVSINHDGLFETDLYKKDTAKVQYLSPASCHPGHITNNIPFSIALSIRRVCSREEDCKIRLEQMRQDLLSRSYPPKIVDGAIKRVNKIDRLDAIKRVSRTKEDKTVLVTTFHPLMPSVSKIIKKHWKVMVDNSTEMKNVFKNPSIVAYKRQKNLKDILIRSKLPPKRPSRVIYGFGKCDSLYCTTHSFAPPGITKKHVCNYTNVTYNIRSSINCKTRNVIYKITCEKCPTFVYIGETERSFHERFSEHRRDAIKQDKTKPCGLHFSKPGHSLEDIQAFAFEEVFRIDQPIFRKERESFWINQYQAIEHGANIRC
jgi:peptide-methionine (R)-S-oxide reductase